jgi:hypothetical protein
MATNALADLKHNTPITTQLSKQLSSEQVVARKCLKILFTTVGFLARQGLALRGHDEDEGNFMQLLHTRCKDVPELSGWLSRRKDFTHHAIQDKMLKLYSNAIGRQILDDIRVSHNFSVIIDRTQDIMRVEQGSLCIRFVDNNLIPHESFLGFYAVDGTTGQIMANCIRDSLCRFNLSLEKLRGQTYDGASNMSGIYSGCQAIIKQLQPLAIYVHCCSHCTHLVGNAACSASTIVANSIQLVNEFGVLCNSSGKFKSLFTKISSCEDVPTKSIKPLCPTRWLVRLKAIKATLQQYGLILSTLEEAESACSTEVSVKASGMLHRFLKGEVVLSLNIAAKILEPLECLNRATQSPKATVVGIVEATSCVWNRLQALRDEEEFNLILIDVDNTITNLNLEPLSLPKRRVPPKRFSGTGDAYHPTDVNEHFKTEYYKVLDACLQQLDDRILKSPAIEQYCGLEAMLIQGKYNCGSVCEKGPDRRTELP